jgi:glutamyl-tRNA reductase
MSELLAIGISHKTAPLDLRERLALTEGRAASVLAEAREASGVHEAAAISTCNRTELYLVISDAVDAENAGLGILSRHAGIPPTLLFGHIYAYRDREAAEHLFRVTAGLESMILGEFEIQGQVKRAYELSLVEGATGPVLNRLFRGALAAGKRARAETRIGEGGVSVPSAAVELARRTLGELASRRVLLIGAGDTAELTAKALAAKGVETVFVANRRYDRAIGLAQRFGGAAVRFDELPEQLADADIVVSSTNSPHHILGRPEMEMVMAERASKPLLLIDLAVPRDVDPACREVTGITVHDVDDVQTVADRNASGREVEARQAQRLLRAEVDRFEQWLGSQQIVPTIAALREHAAGVVSRVLEENEARWEGLTEADRERVEALADAVVSRLLHDPTLKLKRTEDPETAYRLVAAVRLLFGFDAASDPEAEPATVADLAARRSSKGR